MELPRRPLSARPEAPKQDFREIALRVLRMKGPCVPRDVGREIGKDTLITSAILSELSSNKALLISYIKVGSSPLYYLPGQEARLLEFADHLHQREKEALAVLREKTVVRDVDLAPVERVAMRELRDFAKPISVTLSGQDELFWKWYLVSDDEAGRLLRERMAPLVSAPPPVPAVQQNAHIAGAIPALEAVRPEESREAEIPALPAIQERKARKKAAAKLMQQSLEPTEPDDKLYRKVKDYCAEKGIIICSAKVVKKNSELDLLVELPSAVGTLAYCAKVKDKKSCGDADLAAALVLAQGKRLPCLFLTTGKLTKRALAMVSGELKGMVVQRF